MEGEEKLPAKSSELWLTRDNMGVKEYDSDSFEDERTVAKIKPEVELKEETEGFVYKADIRGHLKLVCSDPSIPNGHSSVRDMDMQECPASSHYSRVPLDFKNEFVHESMRPPHGHLNVSSHDLIEEGRYNNNVLSYTPYIATELPQQDYAEPHHSKSFLMDQRCCPDVSDSFMKVNFPNDITKQPVTQVSETAEAQWYNMQAMRVNENFVNLPAFQYVKESYEQIGTNSKPNDSVEDLPQFYQDLLMQKKMEGKMLQTEEQRREKKKEIGRIRAKLYRAKLRQNHELWLKHKAMRAQKQREERRKLSEEQREKVKALARIRAKKHREKLKENEEAWKKYKEMRAEKQRLERLRLKEQLKAEAQHLEVMQVAEQSEKLKELARERAKKHRERLKQDEDTWLIYKESRAQRKREERLTMPTGQRERLKELAKIRARKYREKLKEDPEEWQRYKEMRARKQREERMNRSEEQKQRAKELARERARLYRERKKMKQQMSDKGCDGASWYDSSNSAQNSSSDLQNNNNCSVYFYHTFLQNIPKVIEQ